MKKFVLLLTIIMLTGSTAFGQGKTIYPSQSLPESMEVTESTSDHSVDASADSSVVKRQAILHLLKLTGSDKMALLVMHQMVDIFKKDLYEVPGEFWDSFMEKVDVDELLAMVIPVYDKHFTLPDIQQLIAFYQSPVGQKFVAKQPEVVQESMSIGEKWGEKIAEEVIKELEENGYWDK